MPELPREIPGYRLIKHIGRGTFGSVWLAEEPASQRFVAVKILPKSKTTDREIAGIRRFFAARLRHPAIIDIYFVGETDDAYYCSMELADDLNQHSGTEGGIAADYQPQTLRHLISESAPLPPTQALDIASQILGGLRELHRNDLIHRDIKPENILFVNGRAKISDLGLITSSEGNVTMVGTRGYLPPDDKLDHTADLYATGRMVYEMVTGLPVERFPDLPNRRISDGRELKAHGVAVQLFLSAAHRERKKRAESAFRLLELLNDRRSRVKIRSKVVAAALIVGLAGIGGVFVSRWSGVFKSGITDASQIQSRSAVEGVPLRTSDSRTPGFRLFFGDGTQRDYATKSWVRTVQLSTFWFDKPCVAIGFDSIGPEAGMVKVFAEDDCVQTSNPVPILQIRPCNPPPGAWDFQDHPLACHMQILTPIDVDGAPGEELIVASHHDDGPCEIMVIGMEGRQIGSFWHYGWINACELVRQEPGSAPMVAFIGIANHRASPNPRGRRDEALYGSILVLDWPTLHASKGYWGAADWLCNMSESTPVAYGTLIYPRDENGTWCWGRAVVMEGLGGPVLRIGLRPDLQLDFTPELSAIRASFMPRTGKEEQAPPSVESIWHRTWPKPNIP